MVVEKGMTLLDAAVTSSGSAEDFFAFARLNKLPYTSDVAAGEILLDTGLTYVASTPITNDHLTVAAVKVKAGQTLADMAIQQLGSMEAFFDLCRLNNVGYTADLTNGQQLNYNLTPVSPVMVQFFKDTGYNPASSLNKPGGELPVQLAGIGYWAIQKDFIVQ